MADQITYDFTKVTRDAKKVLTSITVRSRGFAPFEIRAGRVSVQLDDRDKLYGRLTARAVYGVTDFEHDSAYIFQIPIVGFGVELIDNGIIYAHAAILGRESEDLRLKLDSSYDPTKLEGASQCDGKRYCKLGEGKPHPIVPEGFWAGPKTAPGLYAQLLGAKLDIRIIPGPSKSGE